MRPKKNTVLALIRISTPTEWGNRVCEYGGNASNARWHTLKKKLKRTQEICSEHIPCFLCMHVFKFDESRNTSQKKCA